MAGSNFVDYVKIFARSGHGGSGSAHFRREKFVEFGGPDGGDGGRGGHIILRGDSQYWTLIHLKYQRHQFAEDGEGGSGARSSGKNGKDIVIPVPLGTVARRVLEDGTTEYAGEVTADGEELVLLKGGRGGLGNWHFKTSTNQAPRYAQPGEDRSFPLQSPRSPTMPSRRSNPTWVSSSAAITIRSSWPIYRASSKELTKARDWEPVSCAISNAIRCSSL